MVLMGLDMRYVYIYESDVYPEVFPWVKNLASYHKYAYDQAVHIYLLDVDIYIVFSKQK